MRNAVRIILGTMRIQMKNSFVRPMYRFCLIVNPINNTILLYYMFRNSQMSDFMTYVIIGAGLSSLWECICFSSVGDINRERWYGTLPVIFCAPAGFNLIVLGKIIGNTVLSLATMGITVLTAKILFGASIRLANLPGFILAFLLAICTFVVISQVFAYLLTLSRKTTLYMNCLSIPIALVCGFVIPVELLPKWILPLSWSLPMTWAVKLIRGTFDVNFTGKEYLTCFLIQLTEVLIYIIIFKLLYKAIEREVKIKASLELM